MTMKNIFRNTLRQSYAAVLFSAAIAGAASLSAQAPSARFSGGALRAGDRILLAVEGEPTLTDTFTVRPGPVIELPVLGPIRLDGVRRDELQQDMTREIGRFIKNPVVRARALVRVAVLGEVVKPGFYSVPTDALFADIITVAGGPTQNAALNKLHVDRTGVVVQRGAPLQLALSGGETLAELDVQSGDEVVVPKANDFEGHLRLISLIVGIPLAIVTVIVLTHAR
jgi:polysaccharide export outer membrane protein